MRKIFTYCFLALLALATVGLVACEPSSTAVKLTMTLPGQMIVGESETAVVTFDPADQAGPLEWSSSVPAVASVFDGVVTANEAGTTIITAKLASDSKINVSKTLIVKEDSTGSETNYLVDGDTWIFFTGIRYKFDSLDIKLVDPNSKVLELATVSSTTNIYAMNVGETEISNLAGTSVRKIKVVYQVVGFSNGSDLTSFYDNSVKQAYINKSISTITVGAKNDFKYDLSVTALAFDASRAVKTVTPKIEDLTLEYTFQDDQAAPYTFDQVAETTATGIKFKESAAGKKLLVGVMPKYQLEDDDFAAQSWLEIDDGYNAYDNLGLKALYADLTVEKINILRNIVAELTPEQFYIGKDGLPHPYNCYGSGAEAAGKNGSVYHRFGDTSTGHLVVNGNYFTILAKDLPLMVGNTEDGDQGGYVDEGTERVVSSQAAIFRVGRGINKGSYETDDSSVTLSNLTIIGNTNRPVLDDLTLSGGFNGFRHDDIDGYITNTIIRYANQGINTVGTNVVNYAHQAIVTDMWASCIFVYAPGKTVVTESILKNSGAALIDVVDNVSDLDINPIIEVDGLTVLENFCSASSPWFQAYQLSAIQGMMAAIEQGIKQFNAAAAAQQIPFNKTLYADRGSSDLTSKFNFVILIQNENPMLSSSNPQVRAKVTIAGVEAYRPFDYVYENPFIDSLTKSLGAIFLPFGSDFSNTLASKTMEFIGYGMSQPDALSAAFAQSFIAGTLANTVPYIEVTPDFFNCTTIVPLYNIQ